jgi:aminoglycoside/choline kinase family phosphotransferase
LSQADQQRMQALQAWLGSLPGHSFSDVQPASSDASFRRYFRVNDSVTNKSFVVMDAPPDKEDCGPFIYITRLLREAGVNAPAIHQMNQQQGFLLLDDLGNRPYLDYLNNDTADELYADALSAMINMQHIEQAIELPLYDQQRLQDEMNLFEAWYLNKHLEIQLDSQQKASLQHVFNILIQSALEQPQVFVHRDYHSRNLMLLEENNPGVIDYQDAVIGPLTYDLVSLFKDCYIEWPRDKVEAWLDSYLVQTDLPVDFDRRQFIRWFDLMGVQRHLKVLGIFSRLNYRDGKPQYLNDLPLTLRYVLDVSNRYAELSPLLNLLQETVLQVTEH